MIERTGKWIRLILPNNIFYTGKIVFEDEHFIRIIDKFGKEVTIGKNNIISLEEVNSNGS